MTDDELWYEFDPDLDITGQRIRPLHKPFKAEQCEWVPAFGWVFNPTGREFK